MNFKTAYRRRLGNESYAREMLGGKTRQQDKDACDVNLIMARYMKTGLLPPVRSIPQYMDVSEIGDLRTTLERIREAEAFFRTLPATERERFNHNVNEFLSAPETEEGREKLAKLERDMRRQEARDELRRTAESDRLARELRLEMGLSEPGGAGSSSPAPQGSGTSQAQPGASGGLPVS